MRCAVLVVGACLLAATVASGQWVESTIVLPDSLGPLSWPRTLFFDSLNRTVYVGGEYGRCVIGIDPQTGHVRQRVRAGEDVRAMCLNSTNDKVYTADLRNNTVTVFAAASGAVLSRIPVGRWPIALALNPVAGVLYCPNAGDSTVSVIDCAADSVIATIGVGSFPCGICVVPSANKIYCANAYDDNVSVIDGQSNQVIATIAVGGGPINLAHNPLTNRLYCADYLANAVTIIDCAADTVIVTFPAPESPRALCLNPLNNKVYVGCEDVPDGLIIDGNTNAAETTFALSYTTALAYDPDSNRVYAVGLNSDVVCMDGATDSVLASTSVGYDLEAVCYDRVTNRVFCADYDDDVQCVLILDGTTLARLSAVAQEALPNALCFNPTALKLYCANEVYNTVTVIDAGANAVLRNIPVGTRPYLLAHATAVNKLYCANSDDRWTRDSSFSVIDCIADSVIGAIHLSFRPSALLYNPSTNRLYCASGSDSSVKVLDCASNGFTATIRTGRVPVALVMNAAGSRLFSANSSGRSVTVIDATADTAVAEVMLWRQPTAMAYNPVNDHVYCATSDSGRVFVVRSDPPGIVNYVETGGYGIRQVCYVPHENKVYCTRYNGVTVIDCYTDSVVKQIPTSASAGPLSCDTVNRWVYCADPNARTVSVIDAARDSIVAVLPAGDVVALAWNPVDLRTYAANHDDGTITVIRDSLHVGVAESYKLQATSRKPAATIVRGALFLPAFPFTLHSSLFSLSGAKVLDLKPGPNDVRHLSPGVYFVRQASGVLRDASSVTKVVVTR